MRKGGNFPVTTYGQIKTRSLRLLDEYSTTGIVSTTLDVLGRLQVFVNDAIYDLATTTAKIPDKYVIAHNPFYNETSRDTSSVQKHLPDVDFAIQLAGAKSYFFEANGPATVTIDESIAGVWTNLATITIASTVTTLTEYKGLITASAATNAVRINFSGTYAYDYANFVLYPYTFPDAASVQQHRPYFLYDLPTDYFKFNFIEVRKDIRQWIPYTNYRLDEVDKKLGIYRYDIGEYLVHFWRKPTLLTFTGVEVTDDAQVIDTGISPDAIQIIPYFIAAHSLIAEGDTTGKGTMLLNMYEQKKANIMPVETPAAAVLNIYGW